MFSNITYSFQFSLHCSTHAAFVSFITSMFYKVLMLMKTKPLEGWAPLLQMIFPYLVCWWQWWRVLSNEVVQTLFAQLCCPCFVLLGVHVCICLDTDTCDLYYCVSRPRATRNQSHIPPNMANGADKMYRQMTTPKAVNTQTNLRMSQPDMIYWFKKRKCWDLPHACPWNVELQPE